jgi:hypothetical protein
MILDKFTITGSRPVSPLNIPSGWEEINTDSLRKRASKEAVDLDGFDLDGAVKQNPDHLFVKVFAIKKDEVNDNGDWFSETELKRAAKTFIGVPVFVNHQNDDIEKARGKVVHAWYDDNAGGIYTVNMVDKVAFPRLARGIEQGYVTGTSMGCQVQYSCCSICHHRAATAKEFCSHIKERKKKRYTGDHECRYHESPNAGSEPCPVCGCKKGSSHKHSYKDHQIFEHNFGVKFIEDSFVVNPACHDCLVQEILNPEGVRKKIASLVDQVKSINDAFMQASEETFCRDGVCGMKKVAGRQEIGELNEAMNLLERVARSMMAQKNAVSMEYVSDLVKVMSSVQKTADELIEMGYAQLPSPNLKDMAVGTSGPASPISDGRSVQTTPSAMPPASPVALGAPPSQSAQPAQPAALGSPALVDVGDDVGRVTKPTFIPRSASGEELSKKLNIITKGLAAILQDGEYFPMEDSLAQHKLIAKVASGNCSVVIAADSDGETFVTESVDGRIVRASSSDIYPDLVKGTIATDPESAAKIILASLETSETITSKEPVLDNTNRTVKVASQRNDNPPSAITEAQFSSGKGIGQRQEVEYSETIEADSRLGASSPSFKDVTSASPQVRSGSSEGTIEMQLASGSNSFMARWNSFPETITEGQWDNSSREIFAKIPSDWTSVVQGAQLDMLRKDHKWVEPTAVTESQLGNMSKKASSVDLVKIATRGMADAMSVYGLDVKDLANVAAYISAKPSRAAKASFMVAINAAPWTVESRREVAQRNAGMTKGASAALMAEPIDIALAALSDNARGYRSDDLVDAFIHCASNQLALEQAVKLASEASVEMVKESSFDDAIRDAFRPEDGLYKICCTVGDDISASPDDHGAFVSEVAKFAQNMVGSRFPGVDVIPISIDIDDENGTIEAVVKEASMLTDDEKDAYNKFASEAESMKKSARRSHNKVASSGGDSYASREERISRRAKLLEEIERLEKKAQVGGAMPSALNPAGMGAGAAVPGAMPPGMPGAEALTGAPGAMPPGMPGMPAGMPGAPPASPEDPLSMEMDEGKAKPPSAVCVVCGNQDVDVSGGKSKCNGPGCGSGFTIKVVPDASLLDKITDGDIDQEDMSGSDPASPDKGMGGMGAELPPGGAGMPPGLPPVAASTRLTPDIMRKVASKGPIGSVSPISGSRNTMQLDKETWMCLDSGQVYKVRFAASASSPKEIFAQWEWVPEYKKASCSSCRRKRASVDAALKSVGVSRARFDSMPVAKKAEVLNSALQSGSVKPVKMASADDTPIGAFKKAFTMYGEFPTNECMEKLARRYGADSVALSGPCRGSNLPDCVCSKLAEENIYSTSVADKVASSWSQPDPMCECVEDLVRGGMGIKQASSACELLKAAYAEDEEYLADDLADEGGDMLDSADMGDEDDSEPSDPFDDDGMDDELVEDSSPDEDKVTLSLDLTPDMLKMIDEEIRSVLDSHDQADGAEDVEIDEDPVLDDAGDSVSDVADAGKPDHMGVDMDEPVSDGDPVGAPVAALPEPSEVDGDVSEMEPVESESDYSSDDDDDDSSEGKKATMEKTAPNEASSKDDKDSQIEKEAMAMRRGRVVGVGKLELDISKLASALTKEAGEKSIEISRAQDQSDIGKVMTGKAGLKGPKMVENGGKTLESEHGETFNVDSHKPKIPVGGGKFDGDSITAEKGNLATGGNDGSGKSASGKFDRQKLVFDSTIAKLASDLGLKQELVQDQPELGDVGTSDGLEGLAEPEVPQGNESAGLSVPSIPVGGQRGAEKQNIMTGGQVGSGKSGPVGGYAKKKAGNDSGELALKIAGKMVAAGIISPDALPAKADELASYKVAQLVDLDKAMFADGAVMKGLKTASAGSETAFVIPEQKSERSAYGDLKSKITSMFKLHQQVEMADQTESNALRRAFK